jgi:hypothetical protein
MPANTIFSTLTTPPIRLANGNLDTRLDYRNGVAPGGGGDDPVNPAGVIFQENFEAQPEYTAVMYAPDERAQLAADYTMPDNWSAVYQGAIWHPASGYPNLKSSIEILAVNGGRNGSTKCYLGCRESVDSTGGQWHSDGQLIKAPIDPDNTAGTDEIYIEFWIRFSANWFQRGSADGVYPSFSSKIFRISSWTPGGNLFSGAQSDMGPVMLWDYKSDNFGMRNKIGFRGGPPGNTTAGVNNYKVASVESFSNSSSNFNSLSLPGQEVGGTDPQLPDLVNGGLLVNTDQLVTHEMLWGPTATWTKVAFHLKMNSAPGVQDGVLSQFVNGHRIKHYSNIPWVEVSAENLMVKWNHFSIGGNDQFLPFPSTDFFEDYYYIDDIVVRDSLPETLI